jgi:ATP-binding cassette subfamily C protein CydC
VSAPDYRRVSALGDVGRVVGLWRGRSGRLAAGALLSIAALLCGLALTVRAGGVAVGGAVAGVLAAGLLLQLLGVGRILGRYVERLVTHDATFRALADLRVWFFRQVAASAAGGLGFRRRGDLLSRLVGDVEALDSLYLRVGVPVAGALIVLPVLLLVIGRHAPGLGVLVAVLFALGALVLPLVAARGTLAAGDALARGQSALRVAVLDAVGGLREVRVFGAESRVVAGIATHEQALIAAQQRQARSASAADAASFLLGQAALLAVLAAIAADWGRMGDVTVAVVAVFLVLASFEFAAGLPRAGVLAGYAAASAHRVMEVAGRGTPVVASGTGPVPASNTIRFEGVSFGWTSDRPALRDVTLELQPGSRIAILGPSGAGKSTLASLLLGVVHPDSGRITLGGADLATLAPETLRRHVALLSQATHLFADSLRANLLIGRRDATDAELWAALDQAAIGDWVRGLPEGLETWLGEAGTEVSGGQGRRIALARTLLSRAPIIVLDEPASGLDGETERAFLRTLYAGAQRRTIVLIAHRLTGVERLDRIWRLSGGHLSAAAA